MATPRVVPLTQKPVPVLPKDGLKVGDLKRAIPPHLFQRSLLRSMFHLCVDLVEGGLALAVALFLIEKVENPLAFWALYAAYWAFQGPTFTGLWVLAHECGHGGFSNYTIVNDTVGYLVHTALMVPYAAWQASHSKHHHYTNHLTMDEPFVPSRLRDDEVVALEAAGAPVKAVDSISPPSFFHTLTNVLIMETIGWPLYLAVNASGPPADGVVSHYDPATPLVKRRHSWKIWLGNAGLLVWTAAIVWACYAFGTALVVRTYVIPLAICNMFLVSITFLQHTDPDVPHYDAETWTWLRGAVATVDRTLGPWLDYKTHHITDSHVVHHIFSSMPFYNALEATPYVKEALGKYYVQRGNSFGDFLSALWRSAGTCEVVHGKGVLHFVMDQDEAHHFHMPQVSVYDADE